MATNQRINFILLVITAIILIKVHCQDPKLTILPRSPIASAGNSFAFQCKGVSTGDDDDGAFTEMVWINQREEIISNTDPDQGPVVKTQSSNSLKLYFPKAFLEDSGNYTCRALYRNTQTVESSVSITFYEDMKWGECSEKQSLVLDREGEIFCKVSGNPAPTISWEKDSVKLISTDRITIHKDGVTISKVQREDAGKYKIEAFVPLTGNDQMRIFEVEVHIPPVIKGLGNEFRTIEGNEYTIDCKAEGFPRPRYTWYDKDMRNLSEIEGFAVEPNEGTLTIRRVESKAGGLYKCLAQNSAGQSEESVRLVVLVKPVIREFQNLTATEGKPTLMVCKADGNPEPTITIRKDSSSNPFAENQNSRISLESMREGPTMLLNLNINPVERRDDGIYYCQASNDAGQTDKAGHIEVRYKPNMLSTQTEVMTWPGNPANLSCIAEANPNATIRWKYQNEEIRPDDTRYIIYGGTSYSNLLVKISDIPTQSDVFGKYECEAVNSLGNSSIEIELKLATTPGQLSQVLFDRVTSTTITFKFLGPSNTGGLPIQGYVVKYWMDEEKEINALSQDWPKDTAYILSNLKPRMSYTFKLAARNAVGVGEHVKNTYQMPVETVPEIPLFTNEDETISDFPYSFKVRWTIPDDNGQPLEYFDIRYFKVEREINGWKQLTKATTIKIENWDNPEYELLNLSPNTYYKAEVRAHNKLGNSFPGHLIFKTSGNNESPSHMPDEENLTLPVIVAIALAAVLLLLILLDVTCYLRFHCGILYLMRYHTCGRSASEKKVRDDKLEDGKACKNRKDTTTGDDIVYRGYPYEETPMM